MARGGIYDTGNLEEWHYWTGFFTDDATGEELALFYCLFREGVKPGELQHRVMFSLGTSRPRISSGRGRCCTVPWRRQPPKARPRRILPVPLQCPERRHELHDDLSRRDRNLGGPMQDGRVEPGRAVCRGFRAGHQEAVRLHADDAHGVRDGDRPWTGQSDPQTMSSISYYYGAPKMAVKGTITVGDRVRRITGIHVAGAPVGQLRDAA